jgi:hypothetical protein
MPRPKSYGDFYITGKDNVLPVFISTNTVQGRNKYILDLKSLIDSNDIGADELLKIRRKISINGDVLSCYLNKNQTLEVVLLRGVDWKSQFSGISTGDEIKQIIQGEVTAKIQQSTSTTTPTTTSAPAMKLTRDWQAYYVMPRTGIQIFQDQNALNKNLFLFYIPEYPYGRDRIYASEIKDFYINIQNTSVLGSSSYYYAEKLGFLPSQNSYAIEFDILPSASSSLPSLDVQEMLFKQIDQKLIDNLKIADFTPSQTTQKKYTIDDIKALQRGDLVKINNGKEFNIELTIKRDEKKGLSDGKLADMRDINDGTFHVDIFYRIGWFKSYFDDPDYIVEIIKGGAKDDTVNIPSILSVAEEDLQRAKKELSQLLMLKSFTSSVEFERKIEINQKISEVQKRINDLNFKILERKMSKDDIFEDLFEQSFTPINNTYTEVFAPSSDGSGEGVSADFFAPDGSPSKLSDSLNELIRTPQFLEWFGNWQLAYAYKDTDAVDISCSKVVTKDYEPLVVWHGTGQQFSYFRFDNFPAAYFAVNWRYSKWFADLHGGGNGYTIPFFLNIRNPLDLTRFETRKIKAKEFFDYIYLMTGMTMVDLEVNPLFMDTNAPAVEPWVYLRNNAKMLKKLSENHVFDGIHFYETNPNVPVGESANRTEAFITFTAEQCKVADPNRGLLLFASLKSFLLKKGGKI